MASASRADEFEALTRPYLDPLYGFAVSRLRDAQMARDVVQETCLKAFRAFDRFERGTDYKAWLFRILVNTILDAYRSAARAAPVVSLDGADAVTQDASPALATAALDPERAFLNKSLAAEIQMALRSLSPEWHAVIHLSVIEGYSYREIGDILGCPIGTVMSRLYRARRALQRRLAHVVGSEAPVEERRRDNVEPIGALRARLKGRTR